MATTRQMILVTTLGLLATPTTASAQPGAGADAGQVVEGQTTLTLTDTSG